MALKKTITDPKSGAIYTDAYGRIDDATLVLAEGRTEPVLNWYFSQGTANSGLNTAVRSDGTIRFSLTLIQSPNPQFVSALQAACANGSIVSPLDALKTALYLLIQQLPSYQGATSV